MKCGLLAQSKQRHWGSPKCQALLPNGHVSCLREGLCFQNFVDFWELDPRGKPRGSTSVGSSGLNKIRLRAAQRVKQSSPCCGSMPITCLSCTYYPQFICDSSNLLIPPTPPLPPWYPLVDNTLVSYIWKLLISADLKSSHHTHAKL